jgi:hypothetical protein
MEKVENKETIIEEVTKQKEKQDELGYFTKVGIVAGMGAVIQLSDIRLYVVGVGTGLLFGKKTGLKTMGVIIGVGAVWNAARYVSGDFDKK